MSLSLSTSAITLTQAPLPEVPWSDSPVRRRHRSWLRRSRLWLSLVLALVAGSQAGIYRVAAHTSLVAPIHCAVVNSTLWMAVLAIGLWTRHKAARPLLATLLVAGAAAQLVYLPEALAQVDGLHQRHFLAATISAHLLSAVALALFPPLRRLTTHAPLRYTFRIYAFSPHYRDLTR